MVEPTPLPIREFRIQLSEVVERAAFKGERFIVTHHGRERVAVVSLEDLAKLREIEAAPAAAKRKARR